MGAIAKRHSVKRAYPVAGSQSLEPNSVVFLAAGYAVAFASAVAANPCAGVATFEVINPGANGDIAAEVETGEHKFANSGDVVAASVGSTAYFSDDSSVSISNGGGARKTAGKIIQVDSDGVWVNIGI